MEDLVSLLGAYVASDDREADFLKRMRALAPSPDCCARSRFEPGHFTASAFVLSPDAGAVALIFHRKLGLWLQPGGHIEPDDPSAASAAAREVREELGVSDLVAATERGGLFDIDVHAIPARPGEPAHAHFDLRFAYVAPSLVLAPGEEVVDAKWVELAALDTTDTDESVRRAVRKLRSSARRAPR